MLKYNPRETALVLVDIQRGFEHPTYWGTARATPSFEKNIESLLTAFRKAECPIFHVYHHSRHEVSPLHPSKESSEFMPCAAPLATEPVFFKNTNSAFIGTGLQAAISESKIKRLVITGLTTGHCISTSIRMASNLDLVDHDYGTPSRNELSRGAIVLVSDATACFNVNYNGVEYEAETLHAMHLAALEDEFCDIDTTSDVVAQLEAVKE